MLKMHLFNVECFEWVLRTMNNSIGQMMSASSEHSQLISNQFAVENLGYSLLEISIGSCQFTGCWERLLEVAASLGCWKYQLEVAGSSAKS